MDGNFLDFYIKKFLVHLRVDSKPFSFLHRQQFFGPFELASVSVLASVINNQILAFSLPPNFGPFTSRCSFWPLFLDCPPI